MPKRKNRNTFGGVEKIDASPEELLERAFFGKDKEILERRRQLDEKDKNKPK